MEDTKQPQADDPTPHIVRETPRNQSLFFRSACARVRVACDDL